MLFKTQGGVTRTEQLLAQLCARSFLALWSYANPFKDDGHEFCDVLAVFGNHVFIFFDREKVLVDLNSSDNPNVAWSRWKRTAVDAQIKTAHGAERYLRSGRKLFLDVRMNQPFPIEIDFSTAIIHKIVVAHGASDACKLFSDQNVSGSLAISYSDNDGFCPFPFMIHVDKRKPVHIFDSNTLPILFSELDTVADFSAYLDEKTRAIEKYDSLTYCAEEDLLADYLLNISDNSGKHCIGTGDRNFNFYGIDQGAWEYLKLLPQYEATKEANRTSYLWDGLIDRTCSNYRKVILLGNNDLLRQRSAIHEMAKEPRFIRRAVTDLIWDAVEKFPLPSSTDQIMRHVRLIPSSEKNKAYVFLQLWVPPHLRIDVSAYREKSQTLLATACGAAKNFMPELNTIVGIGILPPKLSRMNHEDFILLDCRDWPDAVREDFEKRNKDFQFFRTEKMSHYEQRVTEFVHPKSSPKSEQE